jgi:predicted anti-sigma-YlaC factor YlaD
VNKHVTDLLGAYHDGELSGLRLRQVEAHLEQCEACQGELSKLLALTALLQESPAAEAITPPERFVAQVGLRLPRRPQQPASRRALELGWRLVPAGLLGAGAFVQTAFILAGIVQTALRMGLGGEVAAQLLPSSQGGLWLGQLASLSGASLSEVALMILQLPSRGGPLGWTTTLYVILLVVIGLLFWSWLASWWVRYGRRQLGVHNNTV